MDKAAVEACISRFLALASDSRVEPITIDFDCVGGHTDAFVSFAQIIEKSPMETTGIATNASSGAALAFLACKRRRIRLDGVVGIHMPDLVKIPFNCLDSEGRIPRSEFKRFKRLSAESIRIVREHSGMPEAELERIAKSIEITYYSSDEALQKGLADEIIP